MFQHVRTKYSFTGFTGYRQASYDVAIADVPREPYLIADVHPADYRDALNPQRGTAVEVEPIVGRG